jgi:hypothetical protein
MSNHSQTIVSAIRGQTDSKNSDHYLRLVLLEIAVYVILLWGLMSIVNLPPFYTS